MEDNKNHQSYSNKQVDPSKLQASLVDKKTVDAPKDNQLLTKYYKTQPNDSMLKIAYQINMNVTHLKKINDLLSEELYPGQIIKVIIPSDAEILKNPQFAEHLGDNEVELKKRIQSVSIGIPQKQGLRSSFVNQKRQTDAGEAFAKSFNKQDLANIDEEKEDNQFENNIQDTDASMKLQKKGETMKQVPLHILEQIKGIKQANDRGPSNTVYDKNRKFQIKSDGSGGSDPSTSITHEDIQSQFDNTQMGYQKIQESFSKHHEQQQQEGSRGDILKLFTKISTQDKKKMTECDKIQLSYFIQNQSDKITTEAYYCTKNGKAKGNLKFTEHLILFDPIKCVENDDFDDLESYQAVIDLWDVVSAQKIRTESDTIQFITDPEMRKFYNFTYYIQINLSSINGMTVKKDSLSANYENVPTAQLPALKHVLSTGEEVKHSNEDDKNDQWVLFQDEDNPDKEEVDEVYRKQAQILSKQVSMQDKDSTAEMLLSPGQRTMSISAIQKKYEEPIATVFFRFSHRDRKNQLITNSEQKQIVDNIYNKLLENIKKTKKQSELEHGRQLSPGGNQSSRTHLNFFDYLTADGEDKPAEQSYPQLNQSDANDFTFKFQKLNQKKITVESEPARKGKRLLDDKPAAQAKPNVIRKTELFSGDIFLQDNPTSQRKDRLISRCLPEFTPISKNDSNIMDSKMISQIALYLPSLVRMREWTLLYNIAKDGISFTTFYANVKDRDNTVILIKDTKGKVFGAYCSQSWRKAMHFYGYGDSFVFNFDQDRIIQSFRYTGTNDKIQFSNERSIIIGGGSPYSQKSDPAIYISGDFYKGRSGESETFNNPVLSTEGDFCIDELEIWGFDSI